MRSRHHYNTISSGSWVSPCSAVCINRNFFCHGIKIVNPKQKEKAAQKQPFLEQQIFVVQLFNNIHLFYQSIGIGILVDYKKYVANIYANSSLKIRFKFNVATHGLPVTVKSDSN